VLSHELTALKKLFKNKKWPCSYGNALFLERATRIFMQRIFLSLKVVYNVIFFFRKLPLYTPQSLLLNPLAHSFSLPLFLFKIIFKGYMVFFEVKRCVLLLFYL